MDRRLFTFSVVLAVSITLKPIPITALQRVGQSNGNQQDKVRNPQTQRSRQKEQTQNTSIVVLTDKSSEDAEKSRQQADQNIAIQRQLAESTKTLAKDTHDLSNYTFFLVVIGFLVGAFQLYFLWCQSISTEKAANAATDAAKAALIANRMTEESMRGHLLWNIKLFKPITVGERISVVVSYENAGRSDASVRISTAIQWWDKMPDGDPPLPQLGNAVTMEFRSKGSTVIIDPTPATEEMLAQIRNETKRPFFFGLVVYRTLERDYRIPFCVYPFAIETLQFPDIDQTDSHYALRQCDKWHGAEYN